MKENELENLLSELKYYAEIYRNFPNINKETVFKYENYELRFFHIISIYNTNTIIPLILFLKKILNKKKHIYKECLYLLEILILLNPETKDYNKFFSKIIKKIQNSNNDNIVNIIKIESYDRYGKYFDKNEVKNWLSDIYNKDANFILFWIELYRQYKNKDYKDNTLGLNYDYTLEHLLPKSWQKHWSNIIKDEKEAEELIYQIGNMTLLKGKLNSSLQNMNWQAKLNGDGKARNYISKNADLLINKELLDKKLWNKNEIENRTKKLMNDFFKIWNVNLFF
ncbi:TPA: HNH endonuclease [Campylobacter coli]|nr:HNH endonuclease [Campylobacter coli]